MALLIAPLFTAGIAVGGIQNANATGGVLSCGFTGGTGFATVTLSLGEESGTIIKSIACAEVNDGVYPQDITGVSLVGVVSCTNLVPTTAITPSFSGLIISDDTASWDETITLNSDPGVETFECDIEFDVDTLVAPYITLTQTVTINLGAFCFDRSVTPVAATIYKKFPNNDASDTWVTPDGDVEMTRLSTIDFNGWDVKASKGETVDVVIGSHLSDIVHGGKGNDVLCGDDPRATNSIGDDLILGGWGDDDMWGTYGTTDVGPDEDMLQGGKGDDRMWGQDGPDTMLGGHGADKAFCSQSADDDDDDVVEGGRGIDLVSVRCVDGDTDDPGKQP